MALAASRFLLFTLSHTQTQQQQQQQLSLSLSRSLQSKTKGIRINPPTKKKNPDTKNSPLNFSRIQIPNSNCIIHER